MSSSEKETLVAVKVNGLIYRPGATAPKPMDIHDATLKFGKEGVVQSIDSRRGGEIHIRFKDGERFAIKNMPAIACFRRGPKPEITAGSVPVET